MMQRPYEEEETDRTSCEEECVTLDAQECSEEAKQTKEELKREIEHLKAQVAFLSIWSPTGLDHPHGTDVVLLAAEDGPNGGPSMGVPVHMAMLASRSPIFKAMLEDEMDESRTGTIKISGMSYDALRAFVGYLYAEACLDEQMASELLVLAEKYQVKPLKAYCEKFLVSKLNWDNSIINYVFAHQHNAKLLLEAALSLIKDNLDKLRKRQEYSILVEKDPRLVVELYEACVAKQENDAAPKDTSAKL
ncbi:BTB/POZ domain-containing protein At4g08455-like [Syzygium oleosum]|uniref:BTB/POZ domain-containing protein At4g08455-like n=1 Tax=Syzygium oleosum TaxID=219896 RepID=UPI0011D19AC3|nr:BTB/POZ domain-containing protein At4g08455-like [Syzygium oleosum]